MVEEQTNDFLKKMNGWIKDVSINRNVVLTPFLTLNEQKLLEAHMNNVNINFYGGYIENERKRSVISPKCSNIALEDEVFKIKKLQIKTKSKFVDITHRHVLGTLLSLGINRNQVGDILFYTKS